MEKEHEILNGKSLPIQESTMGTRIKEVATSLGTRKYAAMVAGVAPDTLQRWFKEEAAPSFESISKLALEADYSLEWIKTGVGSKKRGEQGICNPDINERISNDIIDVMIGYGYIDDACANFIKDFVGIYNHSIDRPYPAAYHRQVLLRLISQVKSSIANCERMIEKYSDNPETRDAFTKGRKANMVELERLQAELKETYKGNDNNLTASFDF
ncbi:helix-turn-helix transcriptional regulator [Thiomicrorhabdus sp. Kp2]|uniref:helix-turn-helix domain-containing protein n=1 Tax=Thiomicrorhabdus sp. Kp2 TaxID=1123518 RepID=UPI000411EF48|nr:helix-turn-helix transcriptional regulator [Thiomicrorhabdus sp. Kp2]